MRKVIEESPHLGKSTDYVTISAMHPTPPPIYVRSTISFSFEGQPYRFENIGVSLFGISELQIDALDPTDKIGAEVRVRVEVNCTEPFAFATNALITAEVSSERIYVGLKFSLGENVRARLAETIRKEGYYPTNYARKYPRIPARDIISSMPLRAIARASDELLVFDIANMSPNGILLHSENPKAGFLIPGVRIQAQVEPRGASYATFTFDGVVRRMLMDMNPETRNIKRYLGIRITHIPDDERQNFIEILRAVLDNIQESGLVSK